MFPTPSLADVVSLMIFVLMWIGYSLALSHGPLAQHSLNARMDKYRRSWMLEMVDREVRILDSTIMGSLQNGTAFFASTSLIAMGGAISLLKSPGDAQVLLQSMPLATPIGREMWDVKIFGLVAIFAYAFFKFAWAYRILNFAAILIGATPDPRIAPRAEAVTMAERAAAMITLGGANFNRGQRAFFFALAYLGWFASPYVLIITTVAVVWVMCRRQFGAESLKGLRLSSDDVDIPASPPPPP